jgi:hypothetical protein
MYFSSMVPLEDAARTPERRQEHLENAEGLPAGKLLKQIPGFGTRSIDC